MQSAKTTCHQYSLASVSILHASVYNIASVQRRHRMLQVAHVKVCSKAIRNSYAIFYRKNSFCSCNFFHNCANAIIMKSILFRSTRYVVRVSLKKNTSTTILNATVSIKLYRLSQSSNQNASALVYLKLAIMKIMNVYVIVQKTKVMNATAKKRASNIFP